MKAIYIGPKHSILIYGKEYKVLDKTETGMRLCTDTGFAGVINSYVRIVS